jgi:Family of unknown function (DUF6445)/2OG-Fe(II) oxygenase superfamily
MKPFLLNEVFDVNLELSIKKAGIEGVPGIVIDHFLKHPDQARDILGSAPAANWKHVDGGRNFADYYDCRLRFPVWFPNNMIAIAHQAIEGVFAAKTRPQDPHVDVNWFMQINDKRADFAFPHHDVRSPEHRSFTCLVYLNTQDESSGGTGFFRFKKSGALAQDGAFEQAIVQDARLVENGRDYWPDQVADQWEMIGAVDMVPGRLLIFPSQYFHAAYHPRNAFYDFPRMTLAFWMIY